MVSSLPVFVRIGAQIREMSSTSVEGLLVKYKNASKKVLSSPTMYAASGGSVFKPVVSSWRSRAGELASDHVSCRPTLCINQIVLPYRFVTLMTQHSLANHQERSHDFHSPIALPANCICIALLFIFILTTVRSCSFSQSAGVTPSSRQ
jgi:hypothetical protein